MRRLLESASLRAIWWLHALRYLRTTTTEKKLGTFTPRGELGRLLVVRPMTDRTCTTLVGTRIVKKTTSRPVSDKLAEAITKEERRQVLDK
eukprot:3589463-Amphidinium_carterae.1